MIKTLPPWQGFFMPDAVQSASNPLLRALPAANFLISATLLFAFSDNKMLTITI
jgi:hypothetical protein